MAYQVKSKLESLMLPDKDDWASWEEFEAYHETDTYDFKPDLKSGQAKYKSAASVFTIESGLPFVTVTYNSEADYASSVSDYQTARAAASIDRRTKQVVVSAGEV